MTTPTRTLGIAVLRNPKPEYLKHIMNEQEHLQLRWDAYCLADGFRLSEYGDLAVSNPAYVMAELQRVCKVLKHASEEGK